MSEQPRTPEMDEQTPEERALLDFVNSHQDTGQDYKAVYVSTSEYLIDSLGTGLNERSVLTEYETLLRAAMDTELRKAGSGLSSEKIKQLIEALKPIHYFIRGEDYIKEKVRRSL